MQRASGVVRVGNVFRFLILLFIPLFLGPFSLLGATNRIAIGKFVTGKEADGSPKGWKTVTDSAARVIVVFQTEPEETPLWYGLEDLVKKIMRRNDPFGPRIEYIWGNRIEKGRIIDNPSVKHSRVIVLESGEKKANLWIREKRNLLDDYRAAFGTNPEGILTLGIQTDTDQSNEGVTTYYGEIFLRKQ